MTLRITNQYLFLALAFTWSFIQLLSAQLLIIDSVTLRCIHLAFALSLVFVSMPLFKKNIFCNFLGVLAASFSALYFALNYEAIVKRGGQAATFDIVVGAFLLVFLLEAARRAVGKAIVILATLFMLSSLFASSLPEFIASKDVSLTHLISKLVFSVEGIYGIPLRISADTIFLFVLFGAMLERSGGGHFFVDLALSVLGRYRGGPAKAAVLASGLTGMVSGSSIANTVTTGTFTIPLMIKSGYPKEKAAAIEVAASTNGQLMPPIMGAAAFIIAEYCHMDYLDVVKAALVPALLSYITLLYITHLEACKRSIGRVAEAELPKFTVVFMQGLHFLIPLLFLVYQLVLLRASPAKAAYNAILALMAIIVLRDAVAAKGKEKSLLSALEESALTIGKSLVLGAKNMMGIAVAVGCAGIIVGVVTLGLSGKITEIVALLSGGYFFAILVVTAVVSLILGIGLPTTANYIVIANLSAAAIVSLSVDANIDVPLIAAHLFCFYFGILADDTPPVGLAAYAAAAIAKSDPLKTACQGFFYDLRTALLPFMFIYNTKLLLIGVTSILEGVWIFVSGLIALFAFASVLQHYVVRKNRVYESFMLLLSMLLLLQPTLLGNPLYASLIGLFLFFFVIALQKQRAV